MQAAPRHSIMTLHRHSFTAPPPRGHKLVARRYLFSVPNTMRITKRFQ